MRRLVSVFVIVVLNAGVAGCFTSEGPLVADNAATTPFEEITFQAEGETEVTVGIREGSAYVLQDQETEIALRFLDIGDDTYVVEVSGADGLRIVRLYGAVRLDLNAGTASAYKVYGAPSDQGPGLRSCPDDTICIEDMDAYIAAARAEIASGADPATVYTITVK